MSPATAGWASGNCIAAARTGTPCRSQASREAPGTLDHRGWGGRVVERGAGPRVGEHAAVHHAAGHHRDAPFDARRQEVGERLLVEQRVAVGEQDHVDVGLADEARQHRRLVHPRPDRADDARLAQPVERRVGALDRRLPVIVGVVDVGDVDPVEPQALEALLDRAPDAVRAVVEHDVAARGVRVERVVPAVASLVVEVLAAGEAPPSARRGDRPSSTARTRRAAGRRGAAPIRRSASP